MQQQIVPVGYKFQPADMELVGVYLRNRVTNGASTNPPMIFECDLYGAEPWELWARFRPKYEQLFQGGAGDLDLYLFTKLKKKDPKHKRVERTVSHDKGTWHGNSAAKKVLDHDGRVVIGEVKTFSYKSAKNEQYGKWIMHEYSLSDCAADVVICRLRKKPDAFVNGASSINQHSTRIVENNYNGGGGGVIENCSVLDQEYPADPQIDQIEDWSIEMLTQLINE